MTQPDTDGDGSDGTELSAGTNPTDSTSKPSLNYGLVAWYPFDGNASDMSGNGNDGTVYGQPWVGTAMVMQTGHTVSMG